jgi:hypothetical protein
LTRVYSGKAATASRTAVQSNAGSFQRVLVWSTPIPDQPGQLGRCLRESGHYSEAEPLYKHTLETRQRVLGLEHPDTLTSQNNLALLYDKQDRYSEAEPLHKATLEAFKRVLGWSTPTPCKARTTWHCSMPGGTL